MTKSVTLKWTVKLEQFDCVYGSRACLVAASQAAPTPGSDPRRWISIAWGCDRLPGRQAQARAATKHAPNLGI